ncbi:hypothetical protein RV18_GL000386 [Enterococcus termitis]|nr:hypothetical protein RV18_GL000386 [Enterococcus termitis]
MSFDLRYKNQVHRQKQHQIRLLLSLKNPVFILTMKRSFY